MIGKARCQNCNKGLGMFEENTFRYNPKEVASICQGIGDDSSLVTLQCPDCGCTIQVIV